MKHLLLVAQLALIMASVSVSISVSVTAQAQGSQDCVSYPIGEGIARCDLRLEGLDEKGKEIYGADSLQAVQMASDVEPFLKRLQAKYDLFGLSGEPYFDE